MSHKSILIMAGGTGGHVYPALAVADFLKQHDISILWLGTAQGIESSVVPSHGYPLLTLSVHGVRGKNFLKKLMAPWRILLAIFQAISIMLKHKPDLVLGMGGFASGPGGIAAFLTGKPLCIHEQNSIAGLTNKILYPFATKVFQAFPSAFGKNAMKIVTSGNPVRREILTIATPTERLASRNEKIRLLIVGGSLGAQKLNQIVPKSLHTLSGKLNFEIRHQTGKQKFDETKQYYNDCQLAAEIVPYIDDMNSAYAWADVVICRSGAMTIAELAIVGIPSVLIPYPYAVDDHQTFNAKYLSDSGCAILIPESELTPEKLAAELSAICSSRDHLMNMALAVKELGKPDATYVVAENCMELIHG